MFNENESHALKAVAFENLHEVYSDFILSRQAMMCKKTTLRFYHYTAGKFVSWLDNKGITSPSQISAKFIRAYLSELVARNLSDSYINGHARAIKTLVRFLHQEEYMDNLPNFRMPTIAQKRMPVLDALQVIKILKVCESPRDIALVNVLIDTGVRRKELCELNWGDIHIESGLINIFEGKGGKARSVIIGVKTRRCLLKYRRTILHFEDSPLFQTIQGNRFTHSGLRSCLLNIGKRAKIHISPHILRRTFATLSLRSGMNPLHLQGLLGHSSLEMTRRYVSIVDDDLLAAHKAYGPIDNLV